MDPVIVAIRMELADLADPVIRESSLRFFKEPVKCYGIKTAAVNRIAKQYWRDLKNRDKDQIFSLCEELYRSGYLEESFIVSAWAHALSPRFEPGDISIFETWIDTWINNWASCDGFCNHAVGDFITRYPDSVADLRIWARSRNRWMRRAAAVSLIVPAKKGKFLTEVFGIADLLLTDTDDMVQKGYGWLLKEASRTHTTDVFNYVMQKRKVMPRTALRYAIELMPNEQKREAMKRA